MKHFYHALFSVVFAAHLVFVANSLYAATPLYAASGPDLARRLESKLLSGSGIRMKFSVAGEKVTITANTKAHKARIESTTMLIVTDGTTIWNYQKKTHRLTIDNLSASSPLKNPEQLFQFSSNYTVKLLSETATLHTLEFTPNEKLRAVLKSAGEIESLRLTISDKGKSLAITKATAEGPKGTTETGALTIEGLKTINPKDFTFQRTSNMQVTDLRE